MRENRQQDHERRFVFSDGSPNLAFLFRSAKSEAFHRVGNAPSVSDVRACFNPYRVGFARVTTAATANSAMIGVSGVRIRAFVQ